MHGVATNHADYSHIQEPLLTLQDFKADKQNKELQKRQSKEEKKLKEAKQRLDELTAKADVQ